MRLSKCLADTLADTHSLLRVAVERVGSAVVVHAGGDVDASNCAVWKCVLDEVAAATAAPGPMVVDIEGLDFLSCSAFAALGEAAEQSRRQGITLRLVSTQPRTARILAALGWQHQLPLYEDLWAAVETENASATPNLDRMVP
ncbi:anti-sigma factor antagonist [Mycobacterium sp. pW049]|uniref:anti-sigma factor antagonist n=1 Tax=[Mycobacterium] bulgaricum TaxID=3238985 RepID=UPI00351AB97E